MSEHSPRARLTRRGWVVGVLGVLLLVAGVFLHYPAVTVLGAGLALLVLAERVAVGRRETLGVSREISPLVVARHARCTGRLVVRRARRGTLVRTVANDTVAGEPLPVALDTRDEPDSGVEYVVPTPRRGLVPVGPLLLRRVGPTGMAERVEAHGETVLVRVLPREIPLDALPAGTRRAAVAGAEQVERGGTDITGLHPYVPGDDLRRLHWATSARVGSLMVREDADPSQPHLLVLLDDRRSSYLDPDQFEDAVEVAAALCNTGSRRGNAVHLQTVSGRVDAEAPATTSGLPTAEAAAIGLLLAEVDLSDADSIATVPSRDLDTAVVVAGGAAREDELLLAVAAAGRSVVTLVDDAGEPVADMGGTTVIRGGDADRLVSVWELAVAR